MSQPPTIADVMAAYALDAVDMAREHFQKDLDFSPGSVRLVEEILGRHHDDLPRGFFQKLFKKSPPPEKLDQICKMFGGYLGEVFRRSCGGEWVLDEQISPGHKIPALQAGDKKIWPPAKVNKRIVNGPEDNVWHYFQFVSERWQADGDNQK